jgi:hypothetical protein
VFRVAPGKTLISESGSNSEELTIPFTIAISSARALGNSLMDSESSHSYHIRVPNNLRLTPLSFCGSDGLKRRISCDLTKRTW